MRRISGALHMIMSAVNILYDVSPLGCCRAQKQERLCLSVCLPQTNDKQRTELHIRLPKHERLSNSILVISAALSYLGSAINLLNQQQPRHLVCEGKLAEA